jgi:hypothetical protein
MTFTMKLEGIGELEAAIGKRLAEIGGPMTEKFITIALGEISAHAAPYVPVGETSKLINSEYRKVQKAANGWSGEIGYNAEYAIYVHEGGPKNWQKSGASDQFLLKGAQDFERDALARVIAAVYR